MDFSLHQTKTRTLPRIELQRRPGLGKVGQALWGRMTKTKPRAQMARKAISHILLPKTFPGNKGKLLNWLPSNSSICHTWHIFARQNHNPSSLALVKKLCVLFLNYDCWNKSAFKQQSVAFCVLCQETNTAGFSGKAATCFKLLKNQCFREFVLMLRWNKSSSVWQSFFHSKRCFCFSLVFTKCLQVCTGDNSELV